MNESINRVFLGRLTRRQKRSFYMKIDLEIQKENIYYYNFS